MAIKDATPPPPRNAAVARYRHAREIHDLLSANWGKTRASRHDVCPTFDQVEAVLLADDALRAKAGEPMRFRT